MKKLILLLGLVCLVFFSTVAYAAQPINKDLPNVAVLYVNNAKTTYDSDIDEFILENLHKVIAADKYNYIDGKIYLERLQQVGIVDVSTAERADIKDVFDGENIDYVVFLEVQPVMTKDKSGLFSAGKQVTMVVPFKMLDLGAGKYLYNGKFTEQVSDTTFIGTVGNKSVTLKVLKKIHKQLNAVVNERLPLKKSL